MTALTLRDRSRDGLLEIADINLVDAGLRVTVRELIGHGCWIGGLPIGRMRAFAKRTLPGGRVFSTLVRQFTADGSDWATFIVWYAPPGTPWFA